MCPQDRSPLQHPCQLQMKGQQLEAEKQMAFFLGMGLILLLELS